MKRALQNLLLALVNGFILFIFSERLFWSVWRPGDSIPDLIVTWLAYSTLAYLFLSTVWLFRVNNVWSVFLAGAVYGWLTEGGLIHTLYGTEESAPFPISISITALSWHALISVLVGWYATACAITTSRPRWLAVISTCVGVFWGCWATFLWKENPPVITPVAHFLSYAIGITILLAGAWWLDFRVGVTRFRPGWVGTILSLVILGTFYVQHVRRLGWMPLVILPTVLSVALVPLWLHRQRQACATAVMGNRPVRSNLWFLFLMPIAATVVYVAAKPLGLDQVPIASIVYYWITGPIGFAMLVIAIYQCGFRNRSGQPAIHESAADPRGVS
jgi:hypothetical protein